MLKILSAKATETSKSFKALPRRKGEDNLAWMTRAKLSATGVYLLLVGGRDAIAFRLRMAQSHVRYDFTPSHWSHVMLLGQVTRRLADTMVYEISLDPPHGFGFPPPSNAMQEGQLAQYQSADAYPNIALIQVPISDKIFRTKLSRALQDFQKQRGVLDAQDLLLRWLAFIWGVGRTGNPLLDGQGIPSAAMLEVIFGAVGFDLTPGLESRSSCPEAIWQAAKWWHEYYERNNQKAPRGVYCHDDVLLPAQHSTKITM
jgi:hypothetical protein